MRIPPWLLCCAALLALPCLAYADSMPQGYREGCDRTNTANYSGYMSPGWNTSSPKAMIFASDSQYPRTLDNPHDPAGAAAALRKVVADIADYRRRVSGPVPLVVNGDITEHAHGDQRAFVQGLFPQLAGGSGEALILPGLGNHDYGNNVDDCANNGCARDAICDHIHWVDEIGPVTEDYHYAKPVHEGSYSYMVYVGSVALIQLNDSPFYEREFESGTGLPLDPKIKFRITSSLRWLEGALRKARQDNKHVFLNLHKRSAWPSGDTARFKHLIQSYGVQAAFAGHYHNDLGFAPGTSGNFGSVPVFQSGALFNETYLVVEMDYAGGLFLVYSIHSGQGHANKRLVGEYPLKEPPPLPSIDFSDAALVLYEGNDATQEVVCRRSIPYSAFNLGGNSGCINDEARSLRILKAKKGTMIRLFGGYNHVRGEGYAFIYITSDITLPQTVGRFDTSASGNGWRLVKFGGDTLDGKVSSMSMLPDFNAGNSEITLFEGNNLTQHSICTKPIAHNVRFNMGSGDGEGCINDEARSGAWFKVKAGMEVCYYGAWGQSHSEGHTCINAYRDLPLIIIGSFDHNYTAPDGSYSIRSYGDVDGKISSMWAENLFPYPPANTVPGCAPTLTRSLKGHITAGWNNRSPRWLVVASDPEYSGSLRAADTPQRGQPGAAFDDPAYDTLRAVFADISAFRKAKASDGPVPLIVNGDNTDGGLEYERYTMQALYPTLAGGNGEPLFLPGLGNRDYNDNVDVCLAEGKNFCVRDNICDVLQWVDEIKPVAQDYHHGEHVNGGINVHDGSYSYMVYVGDVAMIQLNESPLYERTIVNMRDSGRTEFEVRSALTWLEGALRAARIADKRILVNLHRPGDWGPGDVARFSRLIAQYGVQAAFVGHAHDRLGEMDGEENFGNVPVFQSGALANGSYLIVEMQYATNTFIVYKVPPAAGHAARVKVGEYPLRPEPALPGIDFSDSMMVAFEGNDATQDELCRVPIPFSPFNLQGAYGCDNDEIRSLRILKAPKDTVIRLYGAWDHQQSEGHALITLTQDVLLPVTVGSFDRNLTTSSYTVHKMGSTVLDGKVSSISMGTEEGDFTEPRVVFYEGNDGTEAVVCEILLPFQGFDLNGPHGCDNDEIKSMRIMKASKGTMFRAFGNWGHGRDQGYTFVTVLKDINAPVLVGSFDRTYANDTVKVEKHGSEVLDGKISSLAMFGESYVELFSRNNQSGKVCTHPVAHDVKFDFGVGQGSACPDDTVRSAIWHFPLPGMELCYYGSTGQSYSQGHTCVRVYKANSAQIRINTFDSPVTDPDGAYTIKSFSPGIDGLVSSMWAEDLSLRSSQPQTEQTQTEEPTP
ncbi:hypothetical protein [Stenotrophomonas sp. CFBP8994]|uniref:hypothetical protein n=1 Tax=Stenotrophomonas sp. CFBP8994 TaxID=3096527 RepID=UPI002A6A85AC|nr:hypothetical protein [Stenotrophomonas sp. CFBP8994]MDY0981591.1 hypothetical protein [Stenotrophomonas sp. CFBP8994]